MIRRVLKPKVAFSMFQRMALPFARELADPDAANLSRLARAKTAASVTSIRSGTAAQMCGRDAARYPSPEGRLVASLYQPPLFPGLQAGRQTCPAAGHIFVAGTARRQGFADLGKGLKNNWKTRSKSALVPATEQTQHKEKHPCAPSLLPVSQPLHLACPAVATRLANRPCWGRGPVRPALLWPTGTLSPAPFWALRPTSPIAANTQTAANSGAPAVICTAKGGQGGKANTTNPSIFRPSGQSAPVAVFYSDDAGATQTARPTEGTDHV